MNQIKLMAKLTSIKYQIDYANSEYGNNKNYCIYCGTTTYNGKLGLVHSRHCAITRARELIKELGNE